MATTMAAPETTAHELPRAMGLRDLVLFNIVAVLSLRWFATAAAAGPSSISLWILAALLFFVPQGLAVSYLAAAIPTRAGSTSGLSAPSETGTGFSAAGAIGSTTSSTTRTC